MLLIRLAWPMPKIGVKTLFEAVSMLVLITVSQVVIAPNPISIASNPPPLIGASAGTVDQSKLGVVVYSRT